MKSFNKLSTLTGWLMFAVAATVYTLSAEPTSSLWDCGEFISAAYKLEVVHPPGAPLFLMIGRMFTYVAELFSDDPTNIAYSINVMSGISTAFLVLFICWSTIMLSKLAMVGRHAAPQPGGETIAILGSGVVAALATTFATSVWFSAVEGEVYAMSSGFTGLVLWASLKWYTSDHPKADRWLIFIAYMMGLSIGVHLLSLLAFPFLGVLFYYKKEEMEREAVDFSWKSTIIGFLGGFGALVLVQYFIIPRLPQMAAAVDFMFVNGFGMGLGTGVLFFILLLFAGVIGALVYAHRKNNYYLHLGMMMVAMILVGFSSYGMVVVRANAQAAINMNNPSDPYSMLSYLNREQYGTRPLLYGPHFAAERNNVYTKEKDVYRPIEKDGKVKYGIVDEKMDVGYKSSDMMLFPRLGHFDRAGEYVKWFDLGASGKPTMGDNLGFFFEYQLGYMYWRYFAWNFIGRQNANQGTDGNLIRGNWISGIGPLDELNVHDQSDLPDYIVNEKSRNTYYFLPFILGLIGLLFHVQKRPREAAALGVMFLMTGIAIIVFTNQPPREPRERDYVIVGSIFTFCMWMGMAVPAMFEYFKQYTPGAAPAAMASALALVIGLIPPVLMGAENWDDHSRADQYGARDYAINFLESCADNAIIFTYGDNDTYPLWYAQEVEGIRPDVRVINFSLLAVDWYVDQLRRKINESDKVEMTIPKEAYRGKLRNYIPYQVKKKDRYVNLHDVVKYIGSTPKDMTPQMARQFASYVPARDVYLPVDKEQAIANGAIPKSIPDSMILPVIKFALRKPYQPKNNSPEERSKQGQLIVESPYMTKDEIALLDIISTNAKNGWKRPIYFAVTCRPEKIMGLRDYLMLEGMALRIVPYQSPNRSMTAILMGGVDVDLMYERMIGTEETPSVFRWGNFDKKDVFINESYMPSVHSLQYGFIRLADELRRKGDTERTIKTIDKFFEAFPHMNFPYPQSRMALQAISFYVQMGAEESAKEHLQIMADALQDRLDYYMGLTNETDIKAFGLETNEAMGMAQQVLQFSGLLKDEDFKTRMREQLQPYVPKPKGQEQPLQALPTEQR
ncbi:MAG: DUF2723 domain-containing protein [Aureispira sp.]